jgi:hypothetical protein
MMGIVSFGYLLYKHVPLWGERCHECLSKAKSSPPHPTISLTEGSFDHSPASIYIAVPSEHAITTDCFHNNAYCSAAMTAKTLRRLRVCKLCKTHGKSD